MEKLVQMGFDEEEARDSIERAQGELGIEDDLLSRQEESGPTFRHTIAVTPEVMSDLEAREAVAIYETPGDKAEIVVVGYFDAELEATISASLPEHERVEFAKAVAAYRAQPQHILSPAELGETLVVPRLMSKVQGTLEFADTDVFMEYHDWSLLDHSWRLGEGEFDIRTTARSFEIDLDGRRISYQFATEEEQLPLDVQVEGWTQQALVLWLDRQLRQPDIAQSEMLGWLSRLVHQLAEVRSMHIAALMRCKFILARKAREKIAAARREERHTVYQRHLLAPGAKTEVSFDNTFVFEDGMYQDQRRYRGPWKPTRHFLGPNRVPAFDGTEDGEEFRCAQAIDSVPGVKFWVRNVAKHAASFWLPTARGKFYPDFVALLEDGRLLVVEYKGSLIAEGPDTAEKRAIGELWERRSDGACLFLIAEKSVGGADTRAQILGKVGL